jgi:hypothetical protein
MTNSHENANIDPRKGNVRDQNRSHGSGHGNVQLGPREQEWTGDAEYAQAYPPEVARLLDVICEVIASALGRHQSDTSSTSGTMSRED